MENNVNSYFASVIFDGSRPYYFSTSIPNLVKGNKVVVETVRGEELGEISTPSTPLAFFENNMELKPIIRIATEEDIKAYNENLILAKEAFDICFGIVKKLDLDMKLLQAQYILNKSKVIFVYSSENRVDFRELLKELASTLKTRIELRQIGSRDRSKLIGGLGSCGLPLCCKQFLNEFDGISINMAKNQFLALNISKLSGSCNKLMCCLAFENDTYTEMRLDLPKINTRINYNDDVYKITNINILTNQVRLENNENILLVNLKEVQAILRGEENGVN